MIIFNDHQHKKEHKNKQKQIGTPSNLSYQLQKKEQMIKHRK